MITDTLSMEYIVGYVVTASVVYQLYVGSALQFRLLTNSSIHHTTIYTRLDTHQHFIYNYTTSDGV